MAPDREEVVRLDLPATYTYLHVLSSSIAALLNGIEGIEDRDIMIFNVQLAAHEICSNIVDHAYPPSQEGRIQVVLTLAEAPRRFIIETHDHGNSFDRASVPSPTLDKPQVHGYGLFIVQNLMDEVTYTPQDPGNHWRLVKYL